MRNILAFLCLYISLFSFSQTGINDRKQFNKVDPVVWFKHKSNGYITRYTHDDLTLKIYANDSLYAISIHFKEQTLLNWSKFEYMSWPMTYPILYYNKESYSYYALFEVEYGWPFRYFAYSITPDKAEYLGILEPDPVFAKIYEESEVYVNRDTYESRLDVYADNGNMDVARYDALGNIIFKYHLTEHIPEQISNIKPIDAFDYSIPYPRPDSFKKKLDVDNNGICENYTIEWNDKTIHCAEESATEWRDARNHIYFKGDTLVINDERKLSLVIGNTAYTTRFSFVRPEGYQYPVLVKTEYYVTGTEAIKIECHTEPMPFNEFHHNIHNDNYSIFDEDPVFSLESLEKYSTIYSNVYEYLPLIRPKHIFEVLNKEPLCRENMDSYNRVADNLMVTPQSMQDSMFDWKCFGEWKNPLAGIYSSIYLRYKVMEKFPEYADGYLGIADAYWLLRDYERGKNYYSSYLSRIKNKAAVPQQVFDRINNKNVNKE